MVGVAVGGLLAGAAVARFGMRRCLIAFGIAQAAANLGYVLLARDPSLAMLAGVAFVDAWANALGAMTFVAYLMSRCEPAVSATQYAILTSMSSVGGRVFGFLVGPIHAVVGWSGLWLFSALVAVPALLLITVLPLEDARSAGKT